MQKCGLTRATDLMMTWLERNHLTGSDTVGHIVHSAWRRREVLVNILWSYLTCLRLLITAGLAWNIRPFRIFIFLYVKQVKNCEDWSVEISKLLQPHPTWTLGGFFSAVEAFFDTNPFFFEEVCHLMSHHFTTEAIYRPCLCVHNSNKALPTKKQPHTYPAPCLSRF